MDDPANGVEIIRELGSLIWTYGGRTIMSVANWTEADSTRARQIWAEYQQTHDITDKKGQVVGIDPHTGRIWFGESAFDIKEQLDTEENPPGLFVIRVGSDCYYRKGNQKACLVL